MREEEAVNGNKPYYIFLASRNNKQIEQLLSKEIDK
jgi:hypothetical protein